ncbi:Prefoldin, subunit 4 [Aureobasidium namibiae CBS 147.97]|uniref:Prefoldin subunit 4 n=1 Tax=Aureobasidium namibiae CBS 147.97 TaxID=1043004 RepID=A0A074WWH7_9PEZI|nr:Prefoldin, subunit 4 [Aureobasidium namibiae CBS 147.97]KEQ77560.1 Prefoldin, subunit 4 [Aureobasidium namibiae CBS 147.97]
MAAMMSRRMLSKDEEGEETEVRREDQDKINRFSTLHQREKLLQAELKTKERVLQKEKEDLEEVSSELELADEDEKVSYKIGDSFFLLPLPEVQELLTASIEKIDADVTAVEEKLSEHREEMQQLKTALYGRFGRSINLEA